ncbi:MAG: glycoside hydrolase family 2 [Chitinophagaceae bacterium]|nr:glycoside hydrolase family 2 [Chitinophagaceae bacterium]
MLHKQKLLILIFFLFFGSLGISQKKFDNRKNNFDVIRSGFINPPDSIRVSAFYYWLNNHISKEGVIKDLHAMKEAGITRVFIGANIRNRIDWSRDTTGKSFGKVDVFSKEWWDILHAALKTATELDIEVGLFNCPGWSQSGGPWVKPNQAMRYLDASEIRVKGPARISTVLSATDTFFQDVKVLAIRVPADYKRNLLEVPEAKIASSNIRIVHAAEIGQPKYILSEKESALDIELPYETVVRSFAFYPAEYFNASVEVQIKNDTDFQTIQKAEIIRSRTVEDLAKGFEPHAPYFMSLNEVKAKVFRLVFRKNGAGNSQLSNIVISATPLIKSLAEKKLAKVVGSSPSWTGSKDKTELVQNNNPSVPAAKDVLDISKFMSADGVLNWNAPEGDWIILRAGMRFIDVKNGPASFEAEGLEVDKMNKVHVQSHFNAFIGQVLNSIPANDRRTFKMVIMDSYERGGFNFTDGFLDDFKKRYSYDATPYLPVYSGHIIGSVELSNRFLWDVRRMIADKLSFDYVGGMTAISNQHGLKTWVENYGHSGYPGEFLQYGGQADEVAGEYWVEPITERRFENRAAASAAHTYGKNKVWAESFTSGSWTKTFSYSTYPKELKSISDWAFSQGVNSTVLHLYIQQAYESIYPGIDAWFGTEFNRKNTWFKHADLFTQYHRRCNFMLQQGKNVADVAYYIGEDNPIMRGTLEPKLPKGFNYDFINADVIERDMQVRDGKFILPDGTTYRVLVLPPQETMRPEVLQKIEQLIAKGGIVLGNPPSRSPSLQNYPFADKKVMQLAHSVWGNGFTKKHKYGKGIVFNNVSLHEVLKNINVIPDFYTENDSVSYTHRTLKGKEIYFVANHTKKPIQFSASFRVKGLQPELWDAISGKTRLLSAFEQGANNITIPLKLSSNGSAFIVFDQTRKVSAKNVTSNFPEQTLVTSINGSWQISFEHDSVKRGPDKPVVIYELKDWTKFDDERICYYSGTAVYTTSFMVNIFTTQHSYFLDLGELNATAKVKVNGKYIGGVWTYPFQLNVSNELKSGENLLEVEVINTWKNRLIGDYKLPLNERIVFSRINPWNGDSILQQSGLLGPVVLFTTDERK